MFDSFKSWEGSVSKPEKGIDLSRLLAEYIGKEPSKIIKDLRDKNGGMKTTEMCETHLASGAYSDEHITFLVDNNVISSKQTDALSIQLHNKKKDAEEQLYNHEQDYNKFYYETYNSATNNYIDYQHKIRSFHAKCKLLGDITKQRDNALKEQETYIANQITLLRPEGILRNFKWYKAEQQFKKVSSQRAKLTESVLNWQHNNNRYWQYNSNQYDQIQCDLQNLRLYLCTTKGDHQLNKILSNYSDQITDFIRILQETSHGHDAYKAYINKVKEQLTKFANILKEKKEREAMRLMYKIDKDILDKDIDDIILNHQKVQQIELTRKEDRLHYEFDSFMNTNDTKSILDDTKIILDNIENRPNKNDFIDVLTSITNQIRKECLDAINDIEKMYRGKKHEDVYNMHLTNYSFSERYVTFLTKEYGKQVNGESLLKLYHELIKQKEEIDQHISKDELDYRQFYETVFKPALAAYARYKRNVHRLFSACETFGGIAKQRDRELKQQESEIKEYIDQFGQESHAATESMWRLLSDHKKELGTRFNKVSSQQAKVTERILGWDDLSAWPWQGEKNSPLNKLRAASAELGRCLGEDGMRSLRDLGTEAPSSLSEAPLSLHNKLSDYSNKVGIMANLLELIYKMQKRTGNYINLEKRGLTLFANILKKEKEWNENIWRYRVEGQILAENMEHAWHNYQTVLGISDNSASSSHR